MPTGDPFTELPEPLRGAEEVELTCQTPDYEPELCSGWSGTVELDYRAHLSPEGFLVLPGVGCPECPECGNPHDFRVNDVEVFYG